MKVPNFFSYLAISTVIATMLSACGSSGVTGTPATTNPQNDTGTSTPYTPTISGDYAAYPYSFTTTGSTPNTVTQALHTDTKLIVKINAEAATVNQVPGTYTNFAAEYHCAQYQVTLQSQINGNWTTLGSKVTGYLNVPGTSGCSGGVASQTIDFSAYMTPGHGDVRIQVTSLKTDFYCIEYNKCVATYQQYRYWTTNCYWASNPANQQYACPVKTIYQYHTVNGSLEVQVNGTSFVNP